MRFIFGIVVGAALTLAISYAHDTRMIMFGPDKPFVNWDAVFELAGR